MSAIERFFYGPNPQEVEAKIINYKNEYYTTGIGRDEKTAIFSLHKEEDGYYGAKTMSQIAYTHIASSLILGSLGILALYNITTFPKAATPLFLTALFSRTIYKAGLAFKERSADSVKEVITSAFGTLKGVYCLPLTFATGLYGFYNPLTARRLQTVIHNHWHGGKEVLTLKEAEELGTVKALKEYFKGDKVVLITQMGGLHRIGELNSMNIEVVKQKKED